ncbi:hypothetical protein Tcan_13732 [Toxocara canis]|uniref:Uncharacterized protein n=1 Tax=Toxocara canis TaxID=6265 RepID=A0A0B2UVD8_TOXCA|nr:hypothetical protein Tcan_13732 [Toxocara canis]
MATPSVEDPLSDLMSQLSRTVGGIKRAFVADSSDGQTPSIPKLLPDDFCIKPCGMEDIQYAAQRTAEMMVSMRVCIVVLTVFSVVSMALLTGALFFYILRKGLRRGRYNKVKAPDTCTLRSTGSATLNGAVPSLCRPFTK